MTTTKNRPLTEERNLNDSTSWAIQVITVSEYSIQAALITTYRAAVFAAMLIGEVARNHTASRRTEFKDPPLTKITSKYRIPGFQKQERP